MNTKSIKGGIRIPILGTKPTFAYDKEFKGYVGYQQGFDGEDFLIPLKRLDTWYFVGVVPFSFYVDFNVILDIFASAEFSSFTTLGYYKSFPIYDTEVVVRDGQKKTINHKLDNTAESVGDEYSLQNLELGAALYLNGEFGGSIADILT